MELLRELFISVGISLLVSFVLAKLFSMASPPPSTTPHTIIAQKPTRVSLADQAVQPNQLHRNHHSTARTNGSTLNCNDNDDDNHNHNDNSVVLNRQHSDASLAVGLEKSIQSQGCSTSTSSSASILTEDHVFDETPERAGFPEIEIESVNAGESEGKKGNESDDGDWEGVERTELEKRFGEAVVYVGDKGNADQISRLDSDAKMRLYGLHKVSIEGTCSVPSPMALKVSARVKWNAWQQLGDMSREVAMEQYISLLSRSIPGWTGYDAQGFSDEKSVPVPTVDVHNRHVTKNASALRELKPGDEGCGMTGSIQTP